MRDQGLQEAIRAVGGISELARRIGLSQLSVSNWNCVPADRVVTVEAATGVTRAILRPDLFGERVEAVDDLDLARAREYALLSTLLLGSPDARLLKRLALLRGDATPLGAAHGELAAAAARASAEQVEREYFDLFVGLGRGELLPYASYYLTGFLYERPLSRLRADLKRFGLEQVDGHSEPEDHAAIVCEIMAGLVGGTLAAPPGAGREIFEKHMAPWMGRFFTDLERSSRADFYARVGLLGRTLIEIEAEAFTLPP